MPFAPGRVSTTTGCPVFSVIFWAMMRAMTSVLEPAAKGEMIRVGLSGNPWPWTESADSHAMNTKTHCNVQFNGFMMSCPVSAS